MKKKKICLVASGGGHLTELLRLSDSWKGRNVFFVTTLPIVKDNIKDYGDVYLVGECNRWHPIQVIKVFFKCFKIILKQRPEIVISTGAAPGFLMCICAFLFGANVVWIDSFANVNRLSLSGRMIRPFANLFLTQWPDVAKKYKNVEYFGAIV